MKSKTFESFSLKQWRGGYTCKMKHRAFTLVELIVVVAIFGILAAILFPVFTRPSHHGGRISSCRSNLKQIGLTFIQYAQDYDEKSPPIANARAGYWAGSLQPYVKSWQIFQCPSDASGAALKTTDYYYNARLAQLTIEKITAPSLTILAGEGTGNQLPLYHLRQLPDAWRENENSPATRHGDVANYLFADGHTKWLEPEQITLDKPSENRPTFLVK